MSEFVDISGGCDSTALALYMADKGADFELAFADTGAEFPETYHTVTRVARHIGKKLAVACGGTFYQKLATFGFFLPSMKGRWCTRSLKVMPLEYLEGTHHIGITADEAHRMPEKSRPLVGAGICREDARKMVKKAGLLNPIYLWRSSCSCFCCPFQRRGDWKGLLANHPDLFRLAEQWEEESILNSQGHTWVKGHRLSEIRKGEEGQLRLWPEPEEPCVICRI